MTRYVQHISGQGERFTVNSERSDRWYVRLNNCVLLCLPKSEYILCDPPEVWVDVTAECELKINVLGVQQIWRAGACLDGAVFYRFRKVQMNTLHKCGVEICTTKWAFIVEKREP